MSMPPIRYSGIPMDDEEFVDQDMQQADETIHTASETIYTTSEIQNENVPQNRCTVPNLKCLNCTFLSKCSQTATIVMAVMVLTIFSCLCIVLGYLSVFVLEPKPILDKSYHAFSIPYHQASVNFDAFKVASTNNATRYYGYRTKRDVGKQKVNLASTTNSLHRQRRQSIYVTSPQWKVEWRLQIVFLAVGDNENNIFTRERLEYIHYIERKIMNHTQFKDFCFKDYGIIDKDPAIQTINFCAPLNSLMQYFYPTKDEFDTIHFDGLGTQLANITSTIQFAMATSDHFYYFVDLNVNKTNHKSRLLRTEVLFGSPLKGYPSPYIQSKEQSEKFKDFVLSYVEMLSSSSTDKVKILYGGNEIFDYEVDNVFWNDVKLAAFSLGAILIFMLILTSFSIWLTFFGIFSILLCFPLAVFFYHTVFGVPALGLLNGVAAFVIIGIGVDDVFVFINIYRQATNMKTSGERIKHTMVTAGKATFFTSFTTAAAFAANTASSIPAVHQFGLFMSLIVSCCWITVVIVMPPSLYIWGIGIQSWEEKWLSKICSKLRFRTRDLPEDISAFVGGKQSHTDIQHVGQNHPVEEDDDDHDVPLLTLDDPMDYYIERYGTGHDDEVLLIPDHRNIPQTPDNVDKDSSLMLLMQTILYHYIALPVIKTRRITIALSLIIMITSIILTAQLHSSTKPPQLFKEDTNLQMLMDLKTSMGIIDEISCPKCSAIYDVDDTVKHQPYDIPTKPINPNYPYIASTRKPMTTQRPTLTSIISGVAPRFDAAPVDQTATIGTKAMFYCTVRGEPVPVLKWQKNGRDETGGKASSATFGDLVEGALVFEMVRQTDEGIYMCIATNVYGTVVASAYLHTRGAWVPPITNAPKIPTIPLNPEITQPPGKSVPQSVPDNYNLCNNTDCSKAKDRPMLQTGASVYVVFGIKGIDKSDIEPGHVLEKTKGKVIFDTSFNQQFQLQLNPAVIEGVIKLCKICKQIAAKTDLVRNGSARCFPSAYEMPFDINKVPGCQGLPEPVTVYGRQAPAHVIGGVDQNGTGLLWWAFAFESTTSKGQSYFEAYNQYVKWEELIATIKSDLKNTPYLQTIFQTSEFWPQVMMEVVAVNSAIYSLVLSMVICLVAVAIFASHVTLLLIVFITILEMIFLVAGIFYLAGWEMGGVEAVSLSILVGSSVDYCVHLVEGFLLAGKAIPDQIKNNNAATRQWRTKAAISHIGSSIFSSAMTTIVAAIPLTQTTIQPFAKFGQILAINSSVSIVYCLTVCAAFLAFMGPSGFVSSWKTTLKMTVGTCLVLGLSALTLFIISKCGIFIPGPNGDALFP